MKVSILVFPGVEELDFVGFLEVLAVANRAVGRRWFETEIVGTTKGPITCSGGMRVLPDKTVAQVRGHDMIFVPGGGASRGTGVDAVEKDQRVLSLLRSAARQGKMVWAVCTGALILGSAGLLRNRRAVTHHDFFERLKTHGAKVSRGRTASDGRMTTGGGISSSIDMGLLLVRRSLGARVAGKVQRSMEYRPPSKR